MTSHTVIASIVLFQHTPADLEKTFKSLSDQPEIKKIILIDNGGSAWAKKLSSNLFHYIDAGNNIGFGKAHNLAIKKFAHRTDFFLICNPDISFGSGTLKSLIEEANSNAEGLFMPKILYPDGTRQELCKLLPSPIDLFLRRFSPQLARYTDNRYLLKNADYDKNFFAPSLSGCFMFCRSAALIALKGFDERFFMYMEDVDLARRFAEKHGALYTPVATVYHSFQKGSYKNPKLLKFHIVSAIKYFNKWGWFFDKRRFYLNRKCLKFLPTQKNKP